jgi:DNA-binding transcriptional regulator YiaG
MKQDIEGMSLFQQVLDETPKEVRQQVEWSYDIADKLDAKLRQMGVSQKEFARRVGTSEAAVSKWIGGGHNFTLSTLAKISSVLGEPIISIV